MIGLFDLVLSFFAKPKKRRVNICRDDTWYRTFWDSDAQSTTLAASSLKEAAEDIRAEAIKVASKFKDANDVLLISFAPPADIKWVSHRHKPERLYALTAEEQDEFWVHLVEGLVEPKLKPYVVRKAS